jgi:hypothetical protein
MFWTTYPLFNLIQTIFNGTIFKSLIFEKKSLESPTGIDPIIINQNKNIQLLPDVKEFIKKNFGEPPKTPILDIPENKILGNKDHFIILRDIDKNIIGCIRYHYIGLFITSQNEEIYCVDCFTVNKKWRKQGIGDYLLTYLHNYVNRNNIPYSILLKEGSILPIIHTPLYTGVYVFRKLEKMISKNVSSLLVNDAYKIMDIFSNFNPKLFIIRNNASENQFWKLYENNENNENNTSKILVCFQDTYQRFEENGKVKKICWATGWIESPNITDNIREEASKELSALMYPEFDYVWMNREWVGSNDPAWKIDGFFHWYSYQWATNISIKNSYCILN